MLVVAGFRLKFSRMSIKRIVQTLFLQGGNQLVIMLLAVLAARLLTIEEFGQYSFGFHFATLAATIASMGSGVALAKVWGGLNGVQVSQKVRLCYMHHNSIAAQGGAVLVLIAIPFFYLFGLQLEAAAFCLCFSVYVVMLQANFFVAIGEAPKGNALQLARSLLLIVLFFVFSFFYESKNLVWYAVLFVSMYSVVSVFYFGGRYSFRLSIEKIEGHSSYALQHWLSVFMVYVDILLIKTFSTDTSLAVYSVALFLSSASSFGLYAINANSMSDISGLVTSGDKQQLQKKLTFYAWAAFFISLSFIGCVVTLAYYVELFFGEGYGEAFNIYLILLFGQVFNILAGSVALIVNVSGFPRRVTQVMLLGVAVKLVFGVMLIGQFDIYGMAIAAAVANIMWNIILLFFVVRNLGLNPTIFSSLGQVKSA